jgi:hypothetical protein
MGSNTLALVVTGLCCAAYVADAGAVLCRDLCPDPTRRVYGQCYAVAYVDPDEQACYRCQPAVSTAGNTSYTGDCAVQSRTSSYALVVDPGAPPASLTPQRTVLFLRNVLVTLVDTTGRAGITAELRLGQQLLKQATLNHDAPRAVWTGEVISASALAAASGEGKAWQNTSALFLLLTCLSGLSGGATCPYLLTFDHQWLASDDPTLRTTTAPVQLVPSVSSKDKGLSTAGIIAIAASCSAVAVIIAAVLGALHYRKVAAAEAAASKKRGAFSAAATAQAPEARLRQRQADHGPHTPPGEELTETAPATEADGAATDDGFSPVAAA